MCVVTNMIINQYVLPLILRDIAKGKVLYNYSTYLILVCSQIP